jgi:uncharacterized protein YraI
MIYLPVFIKIDTGFQAILRFCLSNFKGCNVDINDGMDFLNAPLKWALIA